MAGVAAFKTSTIFLILCSIYLQLLLEILRDNINISILDNRTKMIISCILHNKHMDTLVLRQIVRINSCSLIINCTIIPLWLL